MCSIFNSFLLLCFTTSMNSKHRIKYNNKTNGISTLMNYRTENLNILIVLIIIFMRKTILTCNRKHPMFLLSLRMFLRIIHFRSFVSKKLIRAKSRQKLTFEKFDLIHCTSSVKFLGLVFINNKSGH